MGSRGSRPLLALEGVGGKRGGLSTIVVPAGTEVILLVRPRSRQKGTGRILKVVTLKDDVSFLVRTAFLDPPKA